ncbi:MAG: DUF4430 domain-containing protein [Patescibacteria group bacterium]
MKHNLKFLFITVIVAAAGLAVIGGTSIQVSNQLATLVDDEVGPIGAVAGAAVKGQASFIINFGDKSRSFQFEVDQKTTAYQLLQRASIRENLVLETEEYKDLGTIVDGISDYKGGQDDNYWILYVNGKMAQAAIDKTMVNPDDKVELRFEPSPY